MGTATTGRPSLERDRLAESDRRTAAHRDTAVRPDVDGQLPGAAGQLDGDVHPGLRQHADRAVAQALGDLLAESGPAR